MRKISLIFIALLTLGLLASCGKQDNVATQKNSQSSSVKRKENRSSRSSKVSKQNSSLKSKSQSSSSSSVKNPTGTMNFSQLKQGDYSSLVGEWTELGSVSPHYAKLSKTELTNPNTNQMIVTKTGITVDGISLVGTTLKDNAGDHALVYSEEDGLLVASLQNQNVSINWTVTFYPKGTANPFKTSDGPVSNKQNLIAIWTSNNQFTDVFAESATSTDTATTADTKTVKLDIAQLAMNNLASLVGTWVNESNGKQIVVSKEIMNRPEGSMIDMKSGAIVEGTTTNGYPEVIGVVGSGSNIVGIESGYIQGAIGTYDPSVDGSPFAPLTILPAGVKANDNDDSDSTRDRLIVSGGESGYASEAYYRK
jgi:hypothetical protein